MWVGEPRCKAKMMWHPGGHTELTKLLVTSQWHRLTCEDLPGLPSNFPKAVKQSMGQKTGARLRLTTTLIHNNVCCVHWTTEDAVVIGGLSHMNHKGYLNYLPSKCFLKPTNNYYYQQAAIITWTCTQAFSPQCLSPAVLVNLFMCNDAPRRQVGVWKSGTPASKRACYWL